MANQIVINKMGADNHIFDVVALASTYNGYLAKLSSRNTDGTYTVAWPTAVTDKSIVMILAVPLSYSVESTENDFSITTGDIVRAYKMQVGDIVSVPQANITATSTLTVGYVVTVDTDGSGKPECKSAAGGTEVILFNIDELYTKAGVAMAKLRCVLAQ